MWLNRLWPFVPLVIVVAAVACMVWILTPPPQPNYYRPLYQANYAKQLRQLRKHLHKLEHPPPYIRPVEKRQW